MAPYKTNYKATGSGVHDTLISLSSTVQRIMNYIIGKSQKKFHGKIRAVDMRNVLLVMPFVMQDVLKPEVSRWNTTHSQDDSVQDPSNLLVDILCDLLEWYSNFRRPEHTVETIVDLDMKGRALIEKCVAVFPNVKEIKVVDEQGMIGITTTLQRHLVDVLTTSS